MQTYTWTYRLLFAVVAMILLNTLTVYEVSKWTVMLHQEKVWLDKKDEKFASKKIFFLDNKILTEKNISFVQNNDVEADFPNTDISKNSVIDFFFSKKNSLLFFSFSNANVVVFHQNKYLGVAWKMFFNNFIVANAP